ncbi:MAG: hypothetical protein AB7P03_19195 [Kofleriaceae bacterium]
MTRNSSLLPYPEYASAQLKSDCILTQQKCTRCHTTGRIHVLQPQNREQWQPLVRRMRLMASSGIAERDVEPILRCLSSEAETAAASQPAAPAPKSPSDAGVDAAPPNGTPHAPQ